MYPSNNSIGNANIDESVWPYHTMNDHHESNLDDDDISVFSEFGEQPVASTAAPTFPTSTDRNEETAWSSLSSSSSPVTKVQACGRGDIDTPLFSTLLPYKSRISTGTDTSATIISQDASTSKMPKLRHMSDGRFGNGHDQQWACRHEQVNGSAASYYYDRDHDLNECRRLDGMQTSLHGTSQTRAALFELFAASSPPLQERQCRRPNTSVPSSFTTSMNPPPVVVVVNDNIVNNEQHNRNHGMCQSSISQDATFRSTTLNVNPIIASSAPNIPKRHFSEQDYLQLFRNQLEQKRKCRPPQRKDNVSVATTDASIQVSRANCALLATIECSTATAAAASTLPPGNTMVNDPPSPPMPTSAPSLSSSSSSSGSCSSTAAPLTEEQYLYLHMHNLQVVPGSSGTGASSSSSSSSSSDNNVSGRTTASKSTRAQSTTPSTRRQRQCRRRRRLDEFTTRSQSHPTTGRHDNAALRTTGSRSITNTASVLLAARRVVGDTMLVQSQSSRARFSANIGEDQLLSSNHDGNGSVSVPSGTVQMPSAVTSTPTRLGHPLPNQSFPSTSSASYSSSNKHSTMQPFEKRQQQYPLVYKNGCTWAKHPRRLMATATVAAGNVYVTPNVSL
jgi:hypothetical protein